MAVITYKCDHCGREINHMDPIVKCEFEFTGRYLEEYMSYHLCLDCLREFWIITGEFMSETNESSND